jgi:serine/threonine-protein kinase
MKECPQCEFCFEDAVNFCPFDQTQTKASLPGAPLLANRYLLEKRLGRGAMGQVYLARDENLGTRKVAVKTVRQDFLSRDDLQEGEAIVRFEREARAAASIHHPHVVDVTDFGESADGVFFLVMEYVDGETLHHLLRREGTLPVERAVKLLRQIADGVQAAHEAGILHRDLKPGNIFIMTKGKNGGDNKNKSDGFIKVGDFGLAKIINQTVTDASSNATPSSRGIIGTPEFMAPEQMQPELGVDARADIYALGTITYLMLGGRTPFTGDLMQLVTQKIMQVAPLLSTLRVDIPKSVEDVIMRSLEIDPNKRAANVSEWISELEAAARDVEEKTADGISRLVILAPVGAEVYIDDERKGNVGSSERLVLSNVPAGRHVLRVSKTGEPDDERVIKVRDDAEEQVIQAQLKSLVAKKNRSSSLSSNFDTSASPASVMPAIVACTNCGARFAEGVKFCGRCGNSSFRSVGSGENASQNVCPNCATTLLPNAKFCGRCGFKANQTANAELNQISPRVQDKSNDTSGANQKICPHCGADYPPNIKFCGRCGTILD